MTFAKASAIAYGITSAVSLLGRELCVSALRLSEVSTTCHLGIMAATLHLYSERPHEVKAFS